MTAMPTAEMTQIAERLRSDPITGTSVLEELRAGTLTLDEIFQPERIDAECERIERVSIVTLASVKRRFGDVSWAWVSHIPRGHLTLIVGQDGLGKSWLSAYLIAALLGARQFPDGTKGEPVEKVLLLETEQLRGVYAERLAMLGVDDSAVLLLPSSDPEIEDAFFVPNLFDDLARIEHYARLTKAGAVIVDSLSGGHDLDENKSEMRQLLAGLGRLAAGLGVPVIVVHHARKRSALEAAKMTLDRIRGSSTISQFARSVFGLWKPDPNIQTVRVDCLKSNFAAPFASFGFTIDQDGIHFVDAPDEPREATAVDRAVEFLRVELNHEPKRFSDLQTKAEGLGISKNSLYRAKELLGVVAIEGKWSLPVRGT